MNDINWKETVHSDGTSEFISPSNPNIGDKIIFRIKIYKHNPLKTVYLVIAPEGEELVLQMEKRRTDSFFTYYEIDWRVESKLLSYRFMLLSEKKQYWFNARGLVSFVPSDHFNFKLILNFENPIWIPQSIFYQIFPDRFFDGNPSINVKTDEYTYRGRSTVARTWGELPNISSKTYSHVDFYGGDLRGIYEKIPYLLSLGINALYLNPIFTSYSNHKYDTVDFKEIDPHFGNNIEFSKLVQELHQQGIRIILDGVFNHTGSHHTWFKSAQADPHSKYVNYYTFWEHPNNYLSWFGHKSLPKLNYMSQDLKKEIYDDEDSVAQYWLKEPYNVDGWRIDVANMLARQQDYQIFNKIWEELRIAVKSVNPACYLMGEHFFDPTPLLNGTRLDAVMNYRGFYNPVLKWILQTDKIGIITEKQYKRREIKAKFSSETLHRQMLEFRAVLPFQLQLLQFNLLTSHDVPRLMTLMQNDLSRVKLAVIFLFTYIGVPSIYYGDEIGMEGKRDPDCRRCMIWDESKWNSELLLFYKTLIQIRRSSQALQQGSFREIFIQDLIYCFIRQYKEDLVLVVLNNSDEEKLIEIPVWKLGLLSGVFSSLLDDAKIEIQNGSIKILISSKSGNIYSND
ncbi:MAG: maltodextrin glucosidase [Candidatus Kariarchaeaceae archaeon]|jgi:alpha-glucosidase